MNGYKAQLRTTICHNGKFSHIMCRDVIIHAETLKEAREQAELSCLPEHKSSIDLYVYPEFVYSLICLGRKVIRQRVEYVKDGSE